jgi:hypothetical protein
MLTESQYRKLDYEWTQLSISERGFIYEFLRTLYPEKIKLISEARWYNTLADIIGIFDPTGVVDIMNGISYWRQGDKLFAILSWIGAIPVLGDIIAKPVIGALKVGSRSSKAFREAVEAGNAGKIAETASMAGGKIADFVKEVPTWGDKLVNVLKKTVGRIPFGLPFLAGGATLSGKGFVRTVDEWVGLFKNASKQVKTSDDVYKAVLQGAKPLTQAEKELMVKQLTKQKFTAFRGLSGNKQNFTEKYFSGGLGRLWGNRATRSLMTRTKSYLGFLDYLGVGNFDVDPEELEKKYTEAEIQAKLKEYEKTDKAKKYYKEDIEDISDDLPEPPNADGSKSPFNVSNLLGSSSNPIVQLFSTILK